MAPKSLLSLPILFHYKEMLRVFPYNPVASGRLTITLEWVPCLKIIAARDGLRGVKAMERISKILIMVVALFSLIFVGSMGVWAQPLGIMPQRPQQKSEQKVLCSNNGRFVFGQVSASGKDKFMLDTLTGRLWRIAESGGVGLYLTPVTYRIGEGEYAPVPGAISEAGAKGAEKK